MDSIISLDYVSWIITPGLIFIAKLLDVSMATIRHILIYKGMKRIVPALAFVEITIWLIAIAQVMQNLTSITSLMAYSGGFAAGTYAGMWIEEKLALGYTLVRVISQNGDSANQVLRNRISKSGFGITSLNADGLTGSVNVFLVVSERKRLKRLLTILSESNPMPFYTTEDLRTIGSKTAIKNWIPGSFSAEGNLKKR